jgi:hypothetical protein
VNQQSGIFETDDPQLAAVAMAHGGTVLPPSVDTMTNRIVFNFKGIALDFEQQVLNGGVTINAKSMLAALEVVHRTISRNKRARGLRHEGGAR